MAAFAVLRFFYIKGAGTIMAAAAEFALCQDSHVHFIGVISRHLKRFKVAIFTGNTFELHVRVVTE